MFDVFKLEWRRLVRSKTLALLIVAAVGWMLAVPVLMRSDGTEEGMREIFLRYSLGGVFVLVSLALVGSAAGALATERDAKRLSLSLVRPLSAFKLALARIFAQTAVGAIVLAVAFLIVCFRVDCSRPCSHVLSPILPSLRAEAERMYEVYMAEPGTPEAAKKARREDVIGLFERQAVDNYETIATNAAAHWKFAASGDAIRLRFSNAFDMRQDLIGVFSSGSTTLSVSNMTQAALTFPFKGETSEISFENLGRNTLMFRPRKDIQVLRQGDAFGWNLIRAYFSLVAVLALLTSFGTLLSAGLSRPVAMFVAFATLTVGEISPSVSQQYPDELEVPMADRIGLAITRATTEIMRPFDSVAPLERLSMGECVESSDSIRTVAVDLFLAPILFSMIAGLIMPRKSA